MVPENIHTSPTEGIGNSGEKWGSQRPKTLKQCIKLNWNFQRGGGGGGHRANPFRWGGMDIFWNHTFEIPCCFWNFISYKYCMSYRALKISMAFFCYSRCCCIFIPVCLFACFLLQLARAHLVNYRYWK